MFVRWKKRKLRSWGYSYTAVLVESYRVNGKPRQKIIASIATIKDRDYGNSWERSRFWAVVGSSLNLLRDRLTGEDHEKIIDACAQRVPKLTDAEVQEAVVNHQKRRLLGYLLRSA